MKILLRLLLICFISMCRIGLVGDVVININVYFAFAVSSWVFTSFPISFAILTTVGTYYLMLLLLQHPWRTRRHFNASNQWMSRWSAHVLPANKSVSYGEPCTAKGSLRSLAIWGLGGPHITSDLGPGGPISRGAPYRAYTGFQT